MKKFFSTPILILSFGVILPSLIGAEQAKASHDRGIVAETRKCKVVKTSYHWFNVKEKGTGVKLKSFQTDQSGAIEYMWNRDLCTTP
tara:strand:- start:368 stop:628 length:261 start_codon:yes stop_codon:yes gene_type:complete